MTYDGHVDPGASAAVRMLDQAVVRKLSVGPGDNNAYLVTCRRSGAQLMIDAAAEPDRLLELVREGSRGGSLDQVVTTHAHGDHHAGLASVMTTTGARHLCGADDAPAIPARCDRALRHADVLTVGHLTLEVVALRGHTPGSVALLLREPEHVHEVEAMAGRAHLFTGDSLFPGGPGRTRTPEDFRSLMTDLDRRVFDRFADNTWIYPGHGDDTTLGRERPSLAQWWSRGW